MIGIKAVLFFFIMVTADFGYAQAPEETPVGKPVVPAQPLEEPVAAPEVLEEIEDDEDEGINKYMQYLREYSYDPDGRRDPFEEWEEAKPALEQRKAPLKQRKSAITALERWSLDELQLTGIIWGVSKPKAMIKDPSGKVHIVGKDTKVGFNEGYIAVIREGEIVVVEPFEAEGGISYQTKIIRISR